MADINLNINVLDSTGCPTLMFIDETDLSIIVNGGSPILADNQVTVLVPQDTTVTIVVDKTGYDSYVNSIDVGSSDETINILLNPTVPVDFINITKNCHSYTIINNGTDSSYDVTYTITDLDNNVIGDNLNIELDYGVSKVFSTSVDGVYLLKVKDNSEIIIRQYVILDYCTLLSCISNKILNILCPNCNDCKDCGETYCQKVFDLQRIFLLGFDVLSRVNREYRLNSYYTTIDDMKVDELKTAQDMINKLNAYCDCCGCTGTNTSITNFSTVLNNSSTSNSDCGCS